MKYKTQKITFLGNGNPNYSHGFYGTSTYKSWQSMKERCYNPKSTSYFRYGEKGITICNRWLDSFENFLADMGERPEGTTIDRIDGSKGYCKENCRWATKIDQSRNRKSNKLNIEKVIKIKQLLELDMYTNNQIAKMFGVNRTTIYDIKNKRTWREI